MSAIDRHQAHGRGPLDYDRRSNLAFVDGDRGTGKTSVLLSIRQLTEAYPGANEPAAPECPDSIKRLQSNRDRIVWLETLDMEPLPRTANLMAAVLARIDEEIEPPDARPSPRMKAIFDDLNEREKLDADFQQLKIDAALAWQGLNPNRAQHIEQTVYADDVLACERAGLKLNPRLNDVLDAVAKRTGTSPMFVLPVDDVDLNPTRVLELLRLIRMVSCTRLFFLIAGSTRIAEIALELQSEGELADLASNPMATLEATLLRTTAFEIAANNLRKLLPPGQRAALREIRFEEALEFEAWPGGPTLEHSLQKIEFERNNAPEMALRWLGAMLQVLMGKDGMADATREPPGLEEVRTLLEELLNESRPTRYARRYVRRSALVAILLLLAPESACGEALATALLNVRGLEAALMNNESLVRRVRSWRAGTFATWQSSMDLRQRAFDTQTIASLASVSPDGAARIVRQQLEVLLRPLLSEEPELRLPEFPRAPEPLEVALAKGG